MQFQEQYTVDIERPIRADEYLAEKLPYSRSQIQKKIKAGALMVNQKTCIKPGFLVKNQDRLRWKELQGEVKKNIPQGEQDNLMVLYEDDDFLVINKAPGVLSHPSPSSSAPNIADLIQSKLSKNYAKSSDRAGIVHRLDKDTSGVILTAKNPHAHEAAAKAFKQRAVQKFYIALVKGHPKAKGRIEASVKRHHSSREKMAINPQGKEAISLFEEVERFPDCSLLKIEIKTGRTHQIRLHLASIGHPVLGDKTYGDPRVNAAFKEKTGLKRQFLHAAELKILGHDYKAPLAEDLKQCLEKLRSKTT